MSYNMIFPLKVLIFGILVTGLCCDYDNSDDEFYSECPRGCSCGNPNVISNVRCTGGDISHVPESALYVTLESVDETWMKNKILNNVDRLKSLTVTNSSITYVLPHTFDELSQVRIIKLENNQIKSLPEGVFAKNPELVSLYLDQNSLLKINHYTLKGIHKLENLYLRDNMLERLECSIFSSLSTLQNLYLNGNKLSHINSCTFSGLSSLKYLVLDRNQITYLASSAFLGIPLEKLSLRFNKLKTLPNAPLLGMEKMKDMDLSGNMLTKIPSAFFSKMHNLRRLILSGNPISLIHSNAFESLVLLKYLYLQNMPELRTLEKDSFKGLQHLRHLVLTENPLLTMIPAETFPNYQTFSLESLYLINNGLMSLEEGLIGRLPFLKSLYLDGNPLQCDCKMKWLVDIALQDCSVQQHADKIVTKFPWICDWKRLAGSSPFCASPTQFHGKKVTSLNPALLVCGKNQNSQSNKRESDVKVRKENLKTVLGEEENNITKPNMSTYRDSSDGTILFFAVVMAVVTLVSMLTAILVRMFKKYPVRRVENGVIQNENGIDSLSPFYGTKYGSITFSGKERTLACN